MPNTRFCFCAVQPTLGVLQIKYNLETESWYPVKMKGGPSWKTVQILADRNHPNWPLRDLAPELAEMFEALFDVFEIARELWPTAEQIESFGPKVKRCVYLWTINCLKDGNNPHYFHQVCFIYCYICVCMCLCLCVLSI